MLMVSSQISPLSHAKRWMKCAAVQGSNDSRASFERGWPTETIFCGLVALNECWRLLIALGITTQISNRPACRVTFDVQVVEPVRAAVDTATILGIRASFNFQQRSLARLVAI